MLENDSVDLPEAVPAATLILMRPVVGSPPELLMMERTQTMAFAAGALVFPGGRVDPDDHLVAARIGGWDDGAARVAAIRETIEETGLAPGFRELPAPALVTELRQDLERGAPFSALLERHGLELDLGSLTAFARWCPNFRETRRFDTLFFLADAPEGDVRPAAAEAVRTFWASAAQVLDDLAANRVHAIFPTRRNLERLARFRSIEEARADAIRHPVGTVIPWIEERGGTRWLCIPEDIGYPVTAEPLETARRS
jgi:8-oxo-dGTP pyrophosphatase MutT (NUDIX family)